MECLFRSYCYGMEDVFARNKQSSRRTVKHVLNSGCAKENNYRLLIKAVNLLKQS